MSRAKRSPTNKVAVVHGKAKPSLRYNHRTLVVPKIGNNDVVFGRGPSVCSHNGNMQYRRIVCQYKKSYQMSRKSEKQAVIEKVRQAIEKLDPPGRFVEFATRNQLIPVTCKERIHEKISQALRDKKNCLNFDASKPVKKPLEEVVSTSEDREKDSKQDAEICEGPEEKSLKPKRVKKVKKTTKSSASAWPPPLTAREVANVDDTLELALETDRAQEDSSHIFANTVAQKSLKGRIFKPYQDDEALRLKKRSNVKKAKGSRSTVSVTLDKSSMKAFKKNKITKSSFPNLLHSGTAKVSEYGATANISEQVDRLLSLERAVSDAAMTGIAALQENFELFKFPLEKPALWKHDFLELEAEEILPLSATPSYGMGLRQLVPSGVQAQVHPFTKWEACQSIGVLPDDKSGIDHLISEWAGEVVTVTEGIDVPAVSWEEDILSKIASRVADIGVQDRKDHDFEVVGTHHTSSTELRHYEVAWDPHVESLKQPTDFRPDLYNVATPVTPERGNYYFHELDGGTNTIGLANNCIFSF